jgi:peptide/nickel transport system permease protein
VTRDYPVVQAIALIFAVIVVVVNITTDITYARLDPRVRL